MTFLQHHDAPQQTEPSVGANAELVPAIRPSARATQRARPTLFLETLLATRLELLSRDGVWPSHTMAQRQRVLLALWAQRPEGLFEQHGTAASIDQCLHEAFASAGAGSKAQAAMALKRAYYLVCCTISADTSVRRDPGAPPDLRGRGNGNGRAHGKR
ncbi:hypothetical protein [Cupriavidus consociatus]|uniref:hypothetical protein n=1 Tax=Cupriavidus consociatus TaxID=2821357 RepID=UPI001AE55431|nr:MULTISPECIES: hypothetical protein [unclassified Cupriavidus]MBP0623843.1 hypothetical protein [Cupriavidus sp. LEh25]MDK2660550.1 hypothetical protein [Cupriavidus sp. LEh21]